MVEEGDLAPDFELKDENGNLHRLSDFKDKIVVLYFYPKDNTPGCTIEANGFNKVLDELNKLNTVVIGISKDSIESHQKFKSKYNLNFLLLSDEDSKVIKQYGAYGKRPFGMGTLRTTFIIKDGKVVKVFKKVNPRGHEKEVLEFIKTLSAK